METENNNKDLNPNLNSSGINDSVNQSTIIKNLEGELEASRKKNEYDRITISNLKKSQPNLVDAPVAPNPVQMNIPSELIDTINIMKSNIEILTNQNKKNQLVNDLGISKKKFNEINSIYKKEHKTDLTEIKNLDTVKLLVNGFLPDAGVDINISNTPNIPKIKSQANNKFDSKEIRKIMDGKYEQNGSGNAPFKQVFHERAKKR